MRLVLRSDLGGRAAGLPCLQALGAVEVDRPFLILAGGNGTGKSSLLSALRQATGLVGPGLGRFRTYGTGDGLLPLDDGWGHRVVDPDLAKHALFVRSRWGTADAAPPEEAVGVLDPVALGWTGQRVWLHDGRRIDGQDSVRSSMDLTSMRRSADDRVRSHGQQMTGRLRYAAAWALGMFDLRDPFDAMPPGPKDHEYDTQRTPRDIFARLAGHPSHDERRTRERWLLLDEPETGLSPEVLASLMGMLAENAEEGRLRVVCVTHSPLLLSMAGHPKVQVIDMDGYAGRLERARAALADRTATAALARTELARLSGDFPRSLEDRGLEGQGRFTAHEAQSIPYADAVVAPYGKASCLPRMRCAVREDPGSPRRVVDPEPDIFEDDGDADFAP